MGLYDQARPSMTIISYRNLSNLEFLINISTVLEKQFSSLTKVMLTTA